MTPQETLNSGEGFNFQTFLKLILPHSIPLARQKAQKRKLIYETNQVPDIDPSVQQQIAKLLELEIDLFLKSEKIRVELAHDEAYNPVSMFNILDAHGNGEIEYSQVDQLMVKAQIPFKPKTFSGVVRRSRVLSKNQSTQESISFEDYRQLASVQAPYFKHPKRPGGEDSSSQSTVEYSRILGGKVSVTSDSGQLSLSRIPEKLKKNGPQHSTATQVPLYYSSNANVNEVLQRHSKLTQKEEAQGLANDYVWQPLSERLDRVRDEEGVGRTAALIPARQPGGVTIPAITNPKAAELEVTDLSGDDESGAIAARLDAEKSGRPDRRTSAERRYLKED